MTKQNRIASLLEKVKNRPILTALSALVSLFILVGTLVGTWATIKDLLFPPHKVALTNIEYILDVSRHMMEPYKNTTRLDIAKKTLLKNLRLWSDTDVLGFRVFGHGLTKKDHQDCKETQASVKLDTNKKDAIEKALREVQSNGGRAPLGRALVDAMNDFSDIDRFPPQKTKPKIIVITLGMDDCDKNFIDMVKEKQEFYSHLKLDFRIIGLGVNKKDVQRVRGIETLAKVLKGKTYLVDNQEEAERIGDKIYNQERFRIAHSTLFNALRDMSKNLNIAMESLNRKQFANAERTMKKSEGHFADTKTLFQELKSRQYNDVSREIVRLINAIREDQRKALLLVKEMATLIQRGDSRKMEELSQLVNLYNQVRNEYDSRRKDMEDRLEKL